MVEYSATFQLAKPVDMTKASGFLFYNVPNRGNGRVTGDADGHIRLVSGWQGDIPPAPDRQTASVPVVKGLASPTIARFVDMPRGAASLPIVGGLNGGVPRPLPASFNTTTSAHLLRKRSDADPGEPIAAADFAFADCTSTPFPGRPDPTKLCVRGGFDPAYAYELTYVATDPLVLGVGFAATRDLVSFIRSDPGTAVAVNPVAGKGEMDHRGRRFAVGQLPALLSQPGLQPG